MLKSVTVKQGPSCNQEKVFDVTMGSFNGAEIDHERNKNRGTRIVWFNPPCSCNVVINIGERFLLLLDKYFPKEDKFNKIFNRKI